MSYYLVKILVLFIIIYFIYRFNLDRQNLDRQNLDRQNLSRSNKSNQRRSNLSKSGKDIYDIINNLSSYYDYNQQAYLDLLKNVDLFLELIEFIKVNPQGSGDLYENLRDLKNEVLNIFVSFEISLPGEYNSDAYNELNKIMNDELHNIYQIHESYIKDNGMNYTVKLINLNSPPGYNSDKNILDPKNNSYFSRS